MSAATLLVFAMTLLSSAVISTCRKSHLLTRIGSSSSNPLSSLIVINAPSAIGLYFLASFSAVCRLSKSPCCVPVTVHVICSESGIQSGVAATICISFEPSKSALPVTLPVSSILRGVARAEAKGGTSVVSAYFTTVHATPPSVIVSPAFDDEKSIASVPLIPAVAHSRYRPALSPSAYTLSPLL